MQLRLLLQLEIADQSSCLITDVDVLYPDVLCSTAAKSSQCIDLGGIRLARITIQG
jgi:hypothetical protein